MVTGARIRIGADVGGTFTDLMMADDRGQVWAHKVLSTPPHFEQAVLKGIEHLLGQASGEDYKVEQVAHGTTVATNAVLEHRGARTALITTRGFRDILELRRIRSPELYNLSFRKPQGLIERYLCFEITERMSAEGEVLIPLAESELSGLREKLLQEKVEAVAICLLHSYAFPEHEIKIANFLRRHLPNVDISISHEVLRERKEYERTATTVVNAYVQPVMQRYLKSLRKGLSEAEVDAPLFIMQSSGGLAPEHDASVRPVYVLESGPAAGVLAAEQRACVLGLKNVITFDMGGTTAKASLIENGHVSYSAEYEVGASLSAGNRLVGGAGELIRAPSIDIAEVGAGGGSIASVDKAGGLHVGPRSAGAFPGPACYQLGGSEPTVTDADVVLGYIRTGKIADGRVSIDLEAASRAIYNKVAKPLGLELLTAAEGIHRVANARMMRALRAVSTQRGRDPRDFALIGFGGCGPVHAALLADELAVQSTIIPPLPGLFSAIGLLSSPVEHHDVQSCMIRGTSLPVEELRQIHRELEERMAKQFQEEGFSPDQVSFLFSADIRFQGQSSEVRIDFESDRVDQQSLAMLRRDFEREYQRLYGHLADEDNQLEITGMRLIGRAPRPAACTIRPVDALIGSDGVRRAYFGEAWGTIETPVISRQSLSGRVRGPLLIEEYDSTTVVPPFMDAHLDSHFNIILERSDV